MDLTSCPMKGLTFIFVSLLLIAIITIAQNTIQDSHDFMKDPNRCQECHLGDPIFGETDYRDLSFKEDIVTLCHKCHSEESLGRSHPVNVTPPDNMRIPEDLHLDEYMNMTCSTCHDPHKEAYTNLQPTDYVSPISRGSDKTYPSFYLRRDNLKSGLCFACHER
jgi:hypothetical protein